MGNVSLGVVGCVEGKTEDGGPSPANSVHDAAETVNHPGSETSVCHVDLGMAFCCTSYQTTSSTRSSRSLRTGP
jgi:hypothetical protein